jgi:hypothetical protein
VILLYSKAYACAAKKEDCRMNVPSSVNIGHLGAEEDAAGQYDGGKWPFHFVHKSKLIPKVCTLHVYLWLP